MLTLTIGDVLFATPRARIVRLNLDGQEFTFAAGQAIVIGVPGAERRRPYSIASSPEDAHRDGCLELLVGVDADGRAGPHLPLVAGTPIDVDGPFGSFTFPIDPPEQQFVFVAGGTGIAPLRSMMRHALAAWPSRRVGLLYSARTPDDFAYEKELRALAARGAIELRQTVTRAAETDETDWAGNRGRIDRATLATLVHDNRPLCFVCGPAAMVDDIPRLLVEMGVPRERIRIEEW